MKKLIDPDQHEFVLAEWHGSHAKIWAFHVTHNKMIIALSRKDTSEELFIVATGCENITGAFSWKNANIAILTEQPNEWGEVRRHVVDKQSGFNLLCSDVVMFRGPGWVPPSPFEDFIGG
jgi:hypothetical protein